MKVPEQVGKDADNSTGPIYDNAVNSALDAVIRSSGQSYDQFLQGFIHLTAADVGPSVMQNAFGSSTPSPLFLQNNVRSHSPPLFLQPESPCRPCSPPLAPSIRSEEDFEEVIDCCEPASAEVVREPRAKSLQMDNFVADEGSDDEDLQDLAPEYTASFNPPGRAETALLRNQVTVTKPDIEEENILDLIEGSDPETELDQEGLVYDPSLDRPNPGEVEDNDDQPAGDGMVTNVREMLYSARMASPGETPSYVHICNTPETADDSPVTDEVEAFTLDEDFDYDNVILTPKFSLQEQKELDEFARRGREEAEAERQKHKDDSS